MKITPLYPNKNNALATAQVLAGPDGNEFNLEASLQFVSGNSAVEFDFSTFLYRDSEGEPLGTAVDDVRAELAALQALQNHVNEFVEAYSKAAAEALEFVG